MLDSLFLHLHHSHISFVFEYYYLSFFFRYQQCGDECLATIEGIGKMSRVLDV
jgi:hypothetical protein